MKWSLNTYRTGQEWDLDYLIDLVGRTGYHGIEFLMDFDQRHGLEWDTPRERWDEIGDKMKTAGLAVASLTSCQKFDSPEREERDQSVRRVERVIDMADFFGCRHVRVLGDKFADETRGEVVENVGQCLGVLGRYAQPYGIAVSIEMHGSFTSPDAALEAVQIAGEANVGLVFNCVWPEVTSATVGAFHERIAPHVTMVHTHRVEEPQQIGFYRSMFTKLREIGFEGYISNECAYEGPDPEKVLAMYVGLYRAFAGA